MFKNIESIATCADKNAFVAIEDFSDERPFHSKTEFPDCSWTLGERKAIEPLHNFVELKIKTFGTICWFSMHTIEKPVIFQFGTGSFIISKKF